jgi:hypothetical protein
MLSKRETLASRKYPFRTYPGWVEVQLDRPRGQESWFFRGFDWITGDLQRGIPFAGGEVRAGELGLENRAFPDEDSAFDYVLPILRRYRVTMPQNIPA